MRYQDVFSKWLKSKLGFPQGAVSSPILWNFFSRDLVVEAADLSESFADDFHSASLSSDLIEISESLSEAATEKVEWVVDNEMKISAPKSTATHAMDKAGQLPIGR